MKKKEKFLPPSVQPGRKKVAGLLIVIVEEQWELNMHKNHDFRSRDFYKNKTEKYKKLLHSTIQQQQVSNIMTMACSLDWVLWGRHKVGLKDFYC